MRSVITSLLVAGCLSSTAIASQARAAGAAAPGKVCALLPRDLVMKVSSPAGRKALETAKPDEDWVAEAQREAGGKPVPGSSSCSYGPIVVELDGAVKPEQIRNGMRTRTFPYKEHEPVAGVGDAAFFNANSSFANLYVFVGSRYIHVQMGTGYGDDARTLKPNTIELGKAIVQQLR
jgi:hypothetical protein